MNIEWARERAKRLIMDIHFCNEESTEKCAGIKHHMEMIEAALLEAQSREPSEAEIEIRKSLLRRIELLESKENAEAKGFEGWWCEQITKEAFLITNGKHEILAKAAFLAGQASMKAKEGRG